MMCFGLLITQAYSQNGSLIHEGEIQFEKKMNVFKVLDEYYTSDEYPSVKKFAQDYKSQTTKTQSSFFKLSFNDSLMLYEPDLSGTALKASTGRFLSSIAFDNTIFSNLRKDSSISRKQIMGESYLVKDSLKRIHWKVVDEQRDIGGFTCRRANGLIMDSVYVVAFFTDQIVAPGGPESFTGLPGMILGIALPHYHITWFATKVRTTTIAFTSSSIPSKGKQLSNQEFDDVIKNNINLQGGGRQSDYIKVMALL